MNFNKEATSDKKKFGKGGGGGLETKKVLQTVSNEVNTKIQQSTQCRACGTLGKGGGALKPKQYARLCQMR